MLSWKDTDVCIIDINTTYSCREGHRFLQLMDGGGGGGGGAVYCKIHSDHKTVVLG